MDEVQPQEPVDDAPEGGAPEEHSHRATFYDKDVDNKAGEEVADYTVEETNAKEKPE